MNDFEPPWYIIALAWVAEYIVPVTVVTGMLLLACAAWLWHLDRREGRHDAR